MIKEVATHYEKGSKNLDQRKFVSNLIGRVTRSLSSGQEIQYIPSRIDPDIWSKLITKIINQSMVLKLRPWQVIFIIGNLDCDGKIINLGKVKFYDPRKWDFGDTDLIDTSKGFKINTNEEFGSNFQSFSINHQENRIICNGARAVIHVKAVEESSALQIAKTMLLRAIDFLVLEFSDKYYGFKPQTPLYYQINDIQKKRSPGGLSRDEFFGIYKIDKNDEERLKVVNKFVSKTNLKDQINLSVEWYHKGLWDL